MLIWPNMAKFIIIVAVYRVLTPGVCVRACVRACTRVCVSVNTIIKKLRVNQLETLTHDSI